MMFMQGNGVSSKLVIGFIVIISVFSFFSIGVFAESIGPKEDTVSPVILETPYYIDLEPITPIILNPLHFPMVASEFDYFIWNDHGGWWYDSEKTSDNSDDDLMCWASACSNALEYTGWGIVTDPANGDLRDTEDMFANYCHYWVDRGGWMDFGWSWWYDGEDPDPTRVRLDITDSGGGYWPTRDFTDYYHLENDMPEILPRIDEYLHDGYPATLAIRPLGGMGGHAITCWGYKYDPSGYSERFTHPENYYLGIYVTDSDDNKASTASAPPPNTLRYYNVTYNDDLDRWVMQYGWSQWYIELIMALEPPSQAVFGSRPVAHFDGEDGYTGDTITFTGSPSSDPDGDSLQYRWDFDDDGFWDTGWSISPTVTHIWEEGYQGIVRLEVFDGTYKDCYEATVDIVELAHIDFIYIPRITDAGYQLEFIDTSMRLKEDIVDWTWEIPGRDLIKTRDPTVVFDEMGSYDVKLTLRYKDGSSKTLIRKITVSDVTADFTWKPMPQSEGYPVYFKDTSTTITTPIATWRWSFGDGSTSTEQNPPHIYSNHGDYEVSLIVTNQGKTSHSVTKTVSILDMRPAAAFNYEPKPPSAGKQLTFTDLSESLQDEIVSWQWDLGDGTSSSEQNPEHTYSEAGTYVVKLTVTDEDDSSDTITYKLTVNEPSLFDKPTKRNSHGDPTSNEQLILEYINRARADPFAEGKRLGIDIEAGIQSEVTAQPPLAMNMILQKVARAHCDDMREHGFSQTDSQGYTYKERIGNAWYPGRPVGENIAAGDTAVNLYKLLVREVDPKAELNHREILLGVKYTQNEVGVGFTDASGKYDSYLTIDYGYQSENAFLLGVVYLDNDKDGFYDVGEGLSGVTVMPSSGTYYAVTSSSGGYTIPLTESGLLMVTASGGDMDTPISYVVDVNVPGDNVKLDFVISPDDVESYALKIYVEGKGETAPGSGVAHRFESGSQVKLSGKPLQGWEFSHWEIGGQTSTVNPYELVLEGDQTVTAVFMEAEAPVYKLIIDVEGYGSTDPPTGSMEVEEGIVLVEAIPDKGSMFVEWMLNGETVGDENPLELTVEDDVKLVALFTEKIKTEPEKVSTGNPISDLIKAITDLINQLLKLFGGG